MIIKMISTRKCCLHLLTLNDARRTVKSSYRICSIHLSRTGINSCIRTRTIDGVKVPPDAIDPIYNLMVFIVISLNETLWPFSSVQ
jgi:hypothetical protein